jgi:hypothetical protein
VSEHQLSNMLSRSYMTKLVSEHQLSNMLSR